MRRRFIRSPFREDPSEQEGPSLLALLIILNIGAFLLQKLFTVPSGEDQMVAPAGHISLVTLQAGEFWTVFTHLFVHADLVHLAVNMLFLFLFGRRVLAEIGPKHFGYLFFLGGLAGTALQLFAGQDRDRAVLIGASGAVCAVMAAFAVIAPHYSVTGFLRRCFSLRLSARSLVLGMALASLVLDIANRFSPLDNMAHLCHVGGFVFGWLYAARLNVREDRLFSSRWGREPRFRVESLHEEDSPFVPAAKSKRVRREEEADEDFLLPSLPEPVSDQEFLQERVNPILEKLHASGMKSLTEDERRVLNEAAKRLDKDRR